MTVLHLKKLSSVSGRAEETEHGEYQHGHDRKGADKEAEILIVEEIIGYEEIEACRNIQGAEEEVADIIDKQILV